MVMPPRGMTLIEVMVVIVIIAILATIATVGWGRYVRSAARTDATAALTDIRVKQERYRYAQSAYANRVQFASTFLQGGATLPTPTPNSRYLVDVASASTSGFTATATPQGSQVSDECGTFTVNQNGPVVVTGKEKCWNR